VLLFFLHTFIDGPIARLDEQREAGPPATLERSDCGQV